MVDQSTFNNQYDFKRMRSCYWYDIRFFLFPRNGCHSYMINWFINRFIHSFTHSFIHLFIHPSFFHSFGENLKHSRDSFVCSFFGPVCYLFDNGFIKTPHYWGPNEIDNLSEIRLELNLAKSRLLLISIVVNESFSSLTRVPYCVQNITTICQLRMALWKRDFARCQFKTGFRLIFYGMEVRCFSLGFIVARQ